MRASRRRLTVKGKLFFAALLILAMSIGLYAAYTPILKQTAESEANRLAQQQITKCVNEACQKNDIDLNTLMKCETDSSGKLTGISSDMEKINLWKQYLLEELGEALKNQRYTKNIPFGTLLGNSITYGKGPDIEMTVLLGGFVTADVETEVESAGVNQTKYSIYVNVNTKMYTYLPISNFTVDCSTKVFLKEYVIIGSVPSIYTK